MAAACVAVAHRHGLDVPADLSVCGFDDTPLATTIWPELTTIRQPIADLGSFAIDLAEKKAADGSAEHIVLAPELLVRASTTGARP